MSKSYKVGVKTGPDPERERWGENALRFATYQEAEQWAIDLSMRWLAVREITVLESDDEPNRGVAAPTPGTLQ